MYNYNMLEIKSVGEESCVVSVDDGDDQFNYHTLSYNDIVSDLKDVRKEYDAIHYVSPDTSYMTNDVNIQAEWILQQCKWLNNILKKCST